MPTNIESFVKTLESEGVDAGKKAAEKIEADARKQADELIADGKAKAERIIADAEAEAEKIKTRMDSSLELAARDAIFMLREKLSQQLNVLLKLNVDKALNDEETLSVVLRQVIPAYIKEDTEKKLNAEINVSKDLKSRLLESALRELTHSIKNKNAQIDVRYNLAKSGFEFKVEGSTVEVSTEAVTALLSEMIDPDLQRFLENSENTGDKTK
jgi:vacuolar-type H+-ATPase subunit E/Vma4